MAMVTLLVLSVSKKPLASWSSITISGMITPSGVLTGSVVKTNLVAVIDAASTARVT